MDLFKKFADLPICVSHLQLCSNKLREVKNICKSNSNGACYFLHANSIYDGITTVINAISGQVCSKDAFYIECHFWSNYYFSQIVKSSSIVNAFSQFSDYRCCSIHRNEMVINKKK